jgi:hypothetical protein
MPCYTVSESKIDLAKANPDILREALKAEGYTLQATGGVDTLAGYNVRTDVNVYWRKGAGTTLTTTRAQDVTDKAGATLTRAYSAAAVDYAARRNGWTVKQTQDGKYQIIRR